MAIFPEKYYFAQKTTNQQSWKFSKGKYWSQPKRQNSAKLGNFNGSDQIYVYIMIGERKSKISSVKETGRSYGQKFLS